MAGNSTRFTATAWVDDKASGPMKHIGKEAQRMGEGFSKSAGALRLFEDAAGKMGGGVADAGSKIAGVVSVIGTGGPFGLALAAATAGISAAVWAWGHFTEETKRAQEQLDQMAEQTRKTLDEVTKLDEKIRDFGKSALQAQIDQLAKEIELKKQVTEQDKEAIRQSSEVMIGRGQIVAIGEQINEQISSNRTITAESIRIQYAQIRADEIRLEKLQQLLGMEMDSERASKRAAESIRDRTRAQKALNDQLSKNIPDLNEMDKALSDLNNTGGQVALMWQTITKDVEEHGEMSVAAASAVADLGGAIVSAAFAGGEAEKGAAIKSIMSAAARGAAGVAATAAASLPFPADLIVPPIAAASIYGLVSAFASRFAHGGTVVGGIPGRDSVPIMAQRGEVIIPPGLASELRSVVSSNGPRSSSGGGSRGGRPSSGGTTINIHATMLPGKIEQRRALKQASKELSMLRKRGAA